MLITGFCYLKWHGAVDYHVYGNIHVINNFFRATVIHNKRHVKHDKVLIEFTFDLSVTSFFPIGNFSR